MSGTFLAMGVFGWLALSVHIVYKFAPDRFIRGAVPLAVWPVSFLFIGGLLTTFKLYIYWKRTLLKK
jgi:hypothetical protein